MRSRTSGGGRPGSDRAWRRRAQHLQAAAGVATGTGGATPVVTGSAQACGGTRADAVSNGGAWARERAAATVRWKFLEPTGVLEILARVLRVFGDVGGEGRRGVIKAGPLAPV
jgi:hypothetical protein